MHKSLAEAVLQTFRDRTVDDHRALLASFSLSAWTDNYDWLDSHGLALYFLDRLHFLQLDNAIPAPVLQRLEQNLADNRERTAGIFNELVRINRVFDEAGIEYVNVKGISLVPHACKNPGLRLQLDLDIVARDRDAQLCQSALAPFGYTLTGVSRNVWEFQADADVMPSLRDLYKPKPQRAVEVHFIHGDAADDCFSTCQWQSINGHNIRVRQPMDSFLGQATHLFKHLRSEWIRLSWLLEFRHSVKHWSADGPFWLRLRERAAADPDLCTAIGAAIQLATLAFGDFAPPVLCAWTVDTLDPRLRLWLDCYGLEAIMADFPGTKLYLLLPAPASANTTRERRSRLLPLRRPPSVVHIARGASLSAHLRAWSAQAGFVRFRLRFHMTEGFRYLREASRWKKHLAELEP